RDRVREHDLADDAVGLLLGVAHLVVPVALPPVVTGREVLVRVLVLVAPRVEVLEVGRVEVLAVGGVRGAGMTVGRDDRVVVARRGVTGARTVPAVGQESLAPVGPERTTVSATGSKPTPR